jgi:hypothetical protein
MIKIIYKKIIIIFIILILINILINPISLANVNDSRYNRLNDIKSENLSKSSSSSFKKESFLDLPDLNFLSLKSWWGYTNRSGIFVDYDINNSGEHYQSLMQIESNLTFFANDNSTPFGYIIQRPLLDPYSWYKGEILGGNFFFDMDEKPDYITVVIDYTDLIHENNETNNNQTIKVENGVIITGNIFKKINNDLVKIDDTVEFNQYNETSMNDFGFRHFWSNENGEYNMSLCPKEPIDEYHVYDIKAFFQKDDMRIIRKTDPAKSGDFITLDIIFEGKQPETPNTLLSSKIGIINRNITFITSGFDEDDDQIFYKFNWGDGTYSDWIGPYDSREIITAHNSWKIPENYDINVMSKDSKDVLSEWSESSTISIIDKINEYDLNMYQNILTKLIKYLIMII